MILYTFQIHEINPELVDPTAGLAIEINSHYKVNIKPSFTDENLLTN